MKIVLNNRSDSEAISYVALRESSKEKERNSARN